MNYEADPKKLAAELKQATDEVKRFAETAVTEMKNLGRVSEETKWKVAEASRQMSAITERTIGVMDCIFGLGVALVNAGLVTRPELASAFEEILAQQKARPDCQDPERQHGAQTLARLFRRPTYSDDDRPQ